MQNRKRCTECQKEASVTKQRGRRFFPQCGRRFFFSRHGGSRAVGYVNGMMVLVLWSLD